MHLNVNVSFVVRYDAIENQLTADISHLMKILRRRYFVFTAFMYLFSYNIWYCLTNIIFNCRYYLVEKAKDANIIGILVGTLGVGMHIVNLNIKSSYANVEALLDCDLSYEVYLYISAMHAS
jgi:diphthamide biosynthesis protein 2